MTVEHNQDKSTVPTHEDIENLIRQLQPTPSERFYQRLENAPWRQKSGSLLLHRWGFAMALVSIIILAGILISPPLRAMARNWIKYFLPGNQDQLELIIDQLDHQQLYQYASPDNFPYSVEQIIKQAGFHVSQPASLLPGMELIGCRYEAVTQTTVILYRGAGYNLFLSQRPIDAGQEYFSIGASALVEPVSIGENQGEYVSGGWVNQSSYPTSEPKPPSEFYVHWDSSLPQHTLRWQVQGFSYQLRSTGSSSPQKADLIFLAQGIR
jgi:hypothetical protein